jgi:hypothetical protein
MGKIDNTIKQNKSKSKIKIKSKKKTCYLVAICARLPFWVVGGFGDENTKLSLVFFLILIMLLFLIPFLTPCYSSDAQRADASEACRRAWRPMTRSDSASNSHRNQPADHAQ